MPAVSSKDGVCTKCGKEGNLYSSKICRTCNGFKVNIQRRLNDLYKVDPQIVADFNSLSPEAKKAFYNDHHELLGNDLMMQIMQVTSEQRVKRTTNKWMSKGKGLDENDLREKYKNKDPAMLTFLFANAFQFECPVTKRILYIDPEYEVGTLYEEEQTFIHKVMMETETNKKRDAGDTNANNAKKVTYPIP